MPSLFCLLAAGVLAAAQIDGPATREGAQVQLQQRQTLPHARHTADILDVALIAPVGAQLGGSGIDLFDPTRISVHGRSVTQLRHYWGAVDMSDPARAGEPLVDMPSGAWDRLQLHTLWSAAPKVMLVTTTSDGPDSPKHPSVVVSGSMAQGDVGGGLWWPNGWFDRNDARAFGAPQARRALARGKEGELRVVVPLPRGTLVMLGERMEHRHRYLTTTGAEGLTRDTALMAFSHTWRDWPVNLRALVQLRHRDQDGAQWRFDDAQVQTQTGQAWLLQGEAQGFVTPNARLHLALGLGGRTDVGEGTQASGTSYDISDQWLQLARHRDAERLSRWLLHGSAKLSFLPDGRDLWSDADQEAYALDPMLHLVAEGTVSRWQRHAQDVPQRVGERYAGRGIAMMVREGPQDGAVMLHQLRYGLESHWPLGGPGRDLSISGGIDSSGVSDDRGLLTHALGPSAGAMVAWRSRRGLDTFAMLRREPEAITAQVGDFLGSIGPRGSVYAWDDRNSDAVPDASEAGGRLGPFGAPGHGADAQLRRPGHTQLALGMVAPPVWGLRVGLRGVGHVLTDRYTVAARPGGSSRAVPFHDPGGDGRGEVRSPTGGQDLTVAEEPRVPAGYVLTNDAGLTTYLGLEAEIRTQPHAKGSLSVLGATYLNRTGAPFGSFADRNDPGVVSEASATANNRLHQLGRADSDRAFALKIVGAWLPLPGLSVGLAARYRDGQPFTRVVVDETLPQGPTALMATPRGKARHTALMLWDVRVRYETAALKPLGVTATCDVYNLLNSATEIAEDPRTGPTFRRALEAIPGRALWCGAALAFLP